jgi:osmotically-inducible protein OsmY
MATGAAATAGVASSQEGGISGAITDASIKGAINEAWFQYNLDMFSKLSTRVDQGRVLLTGVVQNPEHRVEAVRLVWQVKGVKQVINEIQVADSQGIPGWGRDTWITTRLRTEMTFAKEIQSLNYTIDTVQGVVYLMGVAMSQNELNRVMEIARTIPNVKKVVSYVKMVGEPVQATPVTQ